MNGKLTLPCPACQEVGSDKSRNHLTIWPGGKFSCITHLKDKKHKSRIIELMPELGKPHVDFSKLPKFRSKPRPRPKPNCEGMLARIKAGYPATVRELREFSPSKFLPENETLLFLKLFPVRSILWLAPDVYQSGKPEHVEFFRPRYHWEIFVPKDAGTRICPCAFTNGSFGRSRESVKQHLYTVIESDQIGEDKLYDSKDEFCSLIKWLRDSCKWHLSAVVDSGNKSLHAWFRNPGKADLKRLALYSEALGLDGKYAEPSQPWRLPGVLRENSDRRQSLVYLNLEREL